ncbi:MAG: D-aminoacyl-tRNA deacylase [Desulfobacteraceae bacterium]|jgi:D-aminoacyl-tRNA deacylase
MKAVIQRVTQSRVMVDDQEIGAIGKGLLVLLGVAQDDGEADADWLADKIVGLRIFEDDHGKMNRAVADVNGRMLVVSQFTLLGDSRKGRRPSFVKAAPPDKAKALYRRFVQRVTENGIGVETGRFGAAMKVSLVNDGPVTLIISSPD